MSTSCVEKLLCETRRVALALAEVADDTLAPLGISSLQRAVLETLLREGRPLSLMTLARKQLVTPEVLDQALRVGSKDRGWTRRTNDPAGPCLLSLSHQGHEFLSTVLAAESALLQRLEDDLGEHAIHSTLRTLKRLRRTMSRGWTADVPGCGAA